MSYRDDLDALPEGAFIDGSTVDEPVTDIADFVVIGSGAAGSVAASTLTAAGYDVLILEEGPWIRTSAMTSDFPTAASTLLRGGGAQFTVGRSSMMLVQGRGVGGTTTVNSAIAVRAPEAVIEAWGFGAALDARALDAHYAWLEHRLIVREPAAAALGENNRLFGEAARRLGWAASPAPRFAAQCEGRAACLTGCTRGRKMSMGLTLLPDALSHGARLYSHARALKIESRGRRASGVTALLGPRAMLRAIARRGVIVCASAVQTPNLLRRSGVRSRELGRNFQCHPGLSLTARFDRPIRMEHGATQGFHSTHFATSHQLKLEALSVQPELVAMSIPGAGRALVDELAGYDELATWAAVVKAVALGRVTGLLGGDQVLFTPSRLDVERARTGLRLLTRMMFEAGAREVWPNVHGMPAALRSADDVKRWDDAPLDPRAYQMVATHLFGTARMGNHARSSVVSTRFECHELEGAYVLDSSVFPTNLGTNPQLAIMAIARLGAERIAS